MTDTDKPKRRTLRLRTEPHDSPPSSVMTGRLIATAQDELASIGPGNEAEPVQNRTAESRPYMHIDWAAERAKGPVLVKAPTPPETVFAGTEAAMLAAMPASERRLHQNFVRMVTSDSFATPAYPYTPDLDKIENTRERLTPLDGPHIICQLGAYNHPTQGLFLTRAYRDTSVRDSKWHADVVHTQLNNPVDVICALRSWVKVAEEGGVKPARGTAYGHAEWVVTGDTRMPFAYTLRQEDHVEDPRFEYDTDTLTPLARVG